LDNGNSCLIFVTFLTELFFYRYLPDGYILLDINLVIPVYFSADISLLTLIFAFTLLVALVANRPMLLYTAVIHDYLANKL
jgi:hypothetical protein